LSIRIAARRKHFKYLAIEIDETLCAINVVKTGKALDGTINVHRVQAQFTSRSHKEPVWIWTADENLRKMQHYIDE